MQAHTHAHVEQTHLTAMSRSVWVDHNVKQVIIGALDGYTVARLQMMLPHVGTCKPTTQNVRGRYVHKVHMAITTGFP